MTIFILGIVFILYVLIGYPLLVTLWSRARPQPVTKDFIPRTISLILPVHNGERWLADKLRAIRELNYPQDLIETIVVSNASTDGTVALARQLAWPGMKVIAIPHWLTERHDLSAAHLTVAHAGELTVERLTLLYP